MMWDEVMERVRVVILADITLAGIFGDHFRKAGTGEMQIPGIEWTLLSDVENELWAPMLVQLDIWTRKSEDARAAERRLRSMFHKQTSIVLDDVTLFSVYTDGSDLATPNRAGYTGRGIRFRFSPLRQQYALPAH